MDPCAKSADLDAACRRLRKGRKIGEFSAARARRSCYPTMFEWELLTRSCTITEIILNSTIVGIACLTRAVLRTQDHCPSARAPYEVRIAPESAATIDQERSSSLCFGDKFDETPVDGSSRRQHSANTFSDARVSQSCVPTWTSIYVSRPHRQKRVGYESGQWKQRRECVKLPNTKLHYQV